MKAIFRKKFFVAYKWAQLAIVFVLGKPFLAWEMFRSKGGAYLSSAILLALANYVLFKRKELDMDKLKIQEWGPVQ